METLLHVFCAAAVCLARPSATWQASPRPGLSSLRHPHHAAGTRPAHTLWAWPVAGVRSAVASGHSSPSRSRSGRGGLSGPITAQPRPLLRATYGREACQSSAYTRRCLNGTDASRYNTHSYWRRKRGPRHASGVEFISATFLSALPSSRLRCPRRGRWNREGGRNHNIFLLLSRRGRRKP